MKIPLRSFLTVGSLAFLLPVGAGAADIRVLCGDPISGPLAGLAETYGRDSGHRVELVFAPTIELVKRLAAGEPADAVLFVRRQFDNAVKTGRVMAASRTEFGRIGVGVMVRAGAPAPDISTANALKNALLGADSVVFNERTTGTHFAGVLERLGIADELKGRIVRAEFNAGVFEYVRKGKGKDLGFATMTVIMEDAGKTVRLVGPLPAPLQSYEPYYAGLTVDAKSPDAARAFIRFLMSPQTQATLAKRGVEPPGKQ